MTMTDQQRPAADLAPASELLSSDLECLASPQIADLSRVEPRDDARESALVAHRHEAVRAAAERRLLGATGAVALGVMMSPR